MYESHIPMETNNTFPHEIGREKSISINSKHKYKVTTSIENSSKLRSQVPPLGPPPHQSSIIRKDHKANVELER